MKFEELLAKYGKTVEEVTFEIEGLSDEELEAKFAEVFDADDNTGDDEEENGDDNNDNVDGDNSGDDDSDDEGDNGDNNSDGEDVGSDDDEGAAEGESVVDGEPEKFTKAFTVELSHDDIRNALYVLIQQYETEDGYYYIREVFDSYFVMQDWWSNKIYKQFG